MAKTCNTRRPQGLVVFSRLGVYLRLPGVDVDRFSEAMQGSGILGYIDTLSGGGGRMRKGSEALRAATVHT